MTRVASTITGDELLPGNIEADRRAAEALRRKQRARPVAIAISDLLQEAANDT